MYIEINLLPKEFRPKKTIIRFDVKTILFLVIIIAAAGLGWYFYKLNTEMNALQAEKTSLDNQKKLLKTTMDLQEEVEALEIKVSKRVDIIKELTGDSDLRFSMLTYVNSIMPENLWLQNISEENTGGTLSFSIEGLSYSKESISTFLEKLQSYKNFKSVVLEQIAPAPTEVSDVLEYVVRVQLASAAPAAPAEQSELLTA